MDFNAPSPYGIFQQRNLLASWLATGYGVVLYLALNTRNRLHGLYLILLLYPLCAALVLTQSRIGVVGAITMTGLTALADIPRLRGRPSAILLRLMLFSSLAMFCTGVCLWGMPSGQQADFHHPASTEQRLRVLVGTIKMIEQHPLTGSGLGSFESQFPQALETAGLQSIENNTFTHPHNEVMYVMAEGGVVALTGLLLLGGIWMWSVMCSFKQCGERWLLSLTSLPILLHMMTEYPLYLSVPHLMLLLLLFRAGLPCVALTRIKLPVLFRTTAISLFSLAIVAVLTLLAAGFSTQLALTQAEVDMNAGLLPSLPVADWRSMTQSERLDHDWHMLAANSPVFTHDPQAMALFTEWGYKWLAVHNDAEVSAAMRFIARRRGDIKEAERLRIQAAKVFIDDVRFAKGSE
ncbi:O-antigen ligase family protein [Salmonella enterica subsp. enterica]|nr:O-antigen ligase family protein [Salmonella enterica subsp. enterica]